MTPMRSADGRDARCMSRRSKPVVNRCADPAALYWRIAGTMVSGNEEHDALSRGDRPFKSAVDCAPCRIQVHSVQVEHTLRLDRAVAKALVPTAVEGATAKVPARTWRGRGPRGGTAGRSLSNPSGRLHRCPRFHSGFRE